MWERSRERTSSGQLWLGAQHAAVASGGCARIKRAPMVVRVRMTQTCVKRSSMQICEFWRLRRCRARLDCGVGLVDSLI
jgi:hypothetical protein